MTKQDSYRGGMEGLESVANTIAINDRLHMEQEIKRLAEY